MFNIKDDRKNIIVDFIRADLSEDVVVCLRKTLKEVSPKRQIGINLANITSARNEFFSLLKEFSDDRKICLYNLTADINLLLFIMNYNQYTHLYVNEDDFKEHKRNLVKREFKICAC